jgi:hypothetical protein
MAPSRARARASRARAAAPIGAPNCHFLATACHHLWRIGGITLRTPGWTGPWGPGLWGCLGSPRRHLGKQSALVSKSNRRRLPPKPPAHLPWPPGGGAGGARARAARAQGPLALASFPPLGAAAAACAMRPGASHAAQRARRRGQGRPGVWRGFGCVLCVSPRPAPQQPAGSAVSRPGGAHCRAPGLPRAFPVHGSFQSRLTPATPPGVVLLPPPSRPFPSRRAARPPQLAAPNRASRVIARIKRFG